MKSRMLKLVVGSMIAGGATLALPATAAEEAELLYSGRARVYQNLSADSLESVSTPDAIKAVTQSNVAPTKIWKVLEHGEKVECLACIPLVSKLLYHEDSRAREISAWWLRRRIFGVFGEGQVYSSVVATLTDQGQSAERRAYAAEAIGEFLTKAGVKHVSRAIVEDSDSGVREASVRALERLNSQGTNGELGVALGDSSQGVRLAALRAAGRVNVFSDVASIVELIDDSSELVRRRTAEVLGVMRAGDAVAGLIALTDPETEPDASVRAAAVYALGQIGDAEAQPYVQAAREDDPDKFVRDAARIALRLL